MSHPALIIMAAGLGSRYGGLKQIDPVGPSGELIIDYSIHDALQAGFAKIVFVINPELEGAFREKIGRRIEKRVETIYIHQRIDNLPAGFTVPVGRNKPWGTAHAVMCCRKQIKNPFAVINADDFYGQNSFLELAGLLQNAADHDQMYQYCMVGFDLKNTLPETGYVSRGICKVDAAGYLMEIRERNRIEKFGGTARYTEDGATWSVIADGCTASMNFWGFTPSIFKEIEAGFGPFWRQNQANLAKAEYFLPEVVESLIINKKAMVKVFPSREPWYGVTYAADKPVITAALKGLIKRGVYPARLWED